MLLSTNLIIAIIFLSVRRPIDFGGSNKIKTYSATETGYIISHIGTTKYRKKINSRLTLSDIKIGSTFTMTLISKDIKGGGGNICYKDYLKIINGPNEVKICKSTSQTVWNLSVRSTSITFQLITNNDRYTGSFLLQYNGEYRLYGNPSFS